MWLKSKFDFIEGDSVSDHSTAARKKSHEGEGITMGDRVDMRVTMEVDGKHYVLLNSEYASNVPGADKFFPIIERCCEKERTLWTIYAVGETSVQRKSCGQ